MLSRYAAPKQEISDIIANLFIEFDYAPELYKEYPDEVVISGTTYSGKVGVLRLLNDDIFLFEGDPEDIVKIRKDTNDYGKLSR